MDLKTYLCTIATFCAIYYLSGDQFNSDDDN